MYICIIVYAKELTLVLDKSALSCGLMFLDIQVIFNFTLFGLWGKTLTPKRVYRLRDPLSLLVRHTHT